MVTREKSGGPQKRKIRDHVDGPAAPTPVMKIDLATVIPNNSKITILSLSILLLPT